VERFLLLHLGENTLAEGAPHSGVRRDAPARRNT